MMKKEKKEGRMAKESLVDGITSRPIKSKKMDTILQPPSKTEYHYGLF